MNVEIIREALTLARAVVWESVNMHCEFDDILNSDDAGDAEALDRASELSNIYNDCKAYVAIVRALRELPVPATAAGHEKEKP